VPLAAGPTVNVFFGGAIGLVLGLVAALIAESLDTSIGTIEDVEEYLRIPVLGVVPHIDILKKEEIDYWKEPPPAEEQKKVAEIMGRLVTQYRPKSPIAEAYRNLQTYIKFSGIDKMGNCIMFSSAGIREGKTMTTVNSALSMAQMGYRVALVDADLRRPSVHKVFGIEKEMGLTEAVLGTFKTNDVIKTIDDIMLGNLKTSMVLKTYGMENLSVITSGHTATNPTELLGSQNLVNLIKELKQKFQVVFFDSAPILPVTDSCILSSKIDGVILVYEVGKVARGALRRCKIQIESAKGKTIGIVLNNMRASDMRFGSPYYYYRQKYYGEGEGEQKEESK
ncbi:MAG: AAA family ATPase, partial [Candidatus Omnitrophota bacterium]